MDKLFPDEKIIVTKNFDVHQDWEVPIPGYFIIASANKKELILEFSEEELIEYVHLLQTIRWGMKEVLGIEEAFFFQNEATVHHLFHTWIFPWYSWMDDFGPRKMQSIRPIVDYAKEKMLSESDLARVREAVRKMREYLLKS